MFEPRHDKTNKTSMRPAKTQISLGIRPVWSESSLSAWRKLGSLATYWAQSGCPGWSETSLGAQSRCLFFHVVAHFSLFVASIRTNIHLSYCSLQVLNLFLALLLASFGAESLSEGGEEDTSPNKLQEAIDRFVRSVDDFKSRKKGARFTKCFRTWVMLCLRLEVFCDHFKFELLTVIKYLLSQASELDYWLCKQYKRYKQHVICDS